MTNTEAMTNTTDTTPTALTLQEKFRLLDETLNAELVERRAEIHAAMQGLIAGVPMFLLGPPGTAKSLLVNRVNAYVDGANKFEILMTRFTQMEEVFGPVSLRGLKEDKFRRKLDGYLCTAEIAFVDEAFKANSSILNAFLWAINEGIYRDDVNIIDIPLHFLMCASNEMPQDDSLNALYDRLLLRFKVDPVRDQQSFLQMLRTSIPKNPDPILTWAEIMQAHEESKEIALPEETIGAIGDLRRKLRDQGIEPTERRFVQSVKIIKAAAWLDGCKVAYPEHLRPLQHVLWNDETQIAKVAKIVSEIAAPLDNDARDLLAEVEKLERSFDEIKDADDKTRFSTEIHVKVRRCSNDLASLEARMGDRPSELILELRVRLKSLTSRMLTDIFGVDQAEL